jgi:iron-sulfur cluster assembly protein
MNVLLVSVELKKAESKSHFKGSTMSETQHGNTTKQKIHRQMTIDQILALFPYKAQRLSQEITNAGLHCVGCHAATYETLEAGMMGHGMGEEAIERLVQRLNALLEEADSDPDTISLTPRAAAKYMQILAEEEKQGWGMRFGDEPAGCNGFQHVLDFCEKASSDDEIFESQGIQIFVNKKIVKRLLGSEIDYAESLHGAGFKVSNPSARSSCGCGTSHNY